MTYNSVVNALSPIGRWKLDDTSGAAAVAAVGSNGAYVGSPTLGVTGLIADGGTAVTTDGNTQDITVPLSGLGTGGSILVTFATTDASSDIIFRDHTTSAGTGWFTQLGSGTAAIASRINGSNRTHSGTNSNLFRNGAIHQYLLTTDGTTVTLYLDGTQIDQWTASFAFSTMVTPLHFGRNGSATGTTNFYAMTYDEIALFSTALTSTDAAALWAARTGGTDATITADAGSDATADATTSTPATANAGGSSDATVTATQTQTATIDADASSDGTAAAVPGIVVSGTIDADASSDGTADATVSLPATVDASAASDATADVSQTQAATITADAASDATATAADGSSPPISLEGEGTSDADITAVTINNPTGTDITWGSGRIRDGIGVAFWDPPVDPTPTGLLGNINQMTARVIDTVDVDHLAVTLTTRSESRRRHRHRIIVGGKDVTYFRGVETPEPTYSLVQPLVYGSGSITFPQVDAVFERPGQGALGWLDKFAQVRVQRVDDDGNVVNDPDDPDYLGFIADFDHNGPVLSCTLGGHATGRAALLDRPPPIFPDNSDIGNLLVDCLRHRVHLSAHDAPTTGLILPDGGGGTELDFITNTLALAQERDGTLWTITRGGDGRYRVQAKDTTTIDATIYLDDSWATADLRRDFASEPTRVFMTSVEPSGLRVRFAIAPGLVTDGRPLFPLTDHSHSMHPGDTDTDTDSGGGVTALLWRLWTVSYLDGDSPPAVWTTDANDPVTDAVKRVQDRAGLDPTGNVNLATWAALYDPSRTGYTLRRMHIRPAAQRSYTDPFLRNASGQIIGRNPRYDRSIPPVDASYDAGAGFTRRQDERWAEREIGDANHPNWTGSITVNSGAVIRGRHDPGDPLDSTDLMDARALRPGMNIWLPTWDDGTRVHLSGVDFSDGVPTLAVDTKNRDTMKVWEVIARNRTQRLTPARQWAIGNRSSAQVKDALEPWDDLGGKLDNLLVIPGHTWVRARIVAGRVGQAMHLRLHTTPAAEFVIAYFGSNVWPADLAHTIGDPFTDGGQRNWRRHHQHLTNDLWMVYSAGTGANPCGYHPSKKSEAATDNDAPGADPAGFVTGDYHDDAGFPYFCTDDPVLTMLVYADRDTKMAPGRIMTLQLSDQV